MTDEQLQKIVYAALRAHGDSFWYKEACTEDHNDCGSNVHLFDDILAAVTEAGYEIKITKV